MKDQLRELIEECEQIAGRWNGKDSTYAEEQAHIATDIIDNSKELIELINELNGTDE